MVKEPDRSAQDGPAPANLDARIARSRASLEAALLELMDRKPFRDINVTELARAAGMSRQTFYLHYKTIDEILMRRFEESFAGFGVELMAAIGRGHVDIAMVGERLFAYWRDNRSVIESIRSAGLEREFLKRIRGYIGAVTSQFRRIQDAPAADRQIEGFIDDFVAGGLMFMLNQWLDGDGKPSPDVMGRLLEQMTANFQHLNARIMDEENSDES